MNIPAAVLDLVLPPTCAACGAPSGDGLCSECGSALAGLALADLGAEALGPGIDAIGAYAYDGVIRRAILSMKVGGRHATARPLGRLLRYELGLPEPVAAPWTVTWVPSTRRKRRQRGAEIPRLLAGQGAVGLLRRPRQGPDQTELHVEQRRHAPRGAFIATAHVPSRVLLIDDVRTTGATALAAATALRDGGAEQVMVATLAVA